MSASSVGPSSEKQTRLADDEVIDAELEVTRELIAAGELDEAIERCRHHQSKTELAIPQAIKLIKLFDLLGEKERASSFREQVVGFLASHDDEAMASVLEYLRRAELLIELDAHSEAKRLCELAADEAPEDERLLNPLIALLLHVGEVEKAQKIGKDFCEKHHNRFEILLYLATVFAHFNAQDVALSFLRKAEKKCKTKTQRAKLDHMLAANGVVVPDLDQHSMAVGIFDNFAESYDEKLDLLGNNGPALIQDMLKALMLKTDASRRVLDAGCGTGLCAEHLRPYAKEIIGVDISIPMLEKSRSKGVYDLLARTDLANESTYPEGKFDLIVSADVFVYFGALEHVFGNLFRALNPGGWLVFTVEDESDPAFQSGFRLYPSGRHKHSETYILSALAKSGFPKPKLSERARLRNEMSKPIMGLTIAVQKPALAFG